MVGPQSPNRQTDRTGNIAMDVKRLVYMANQIARNFAAGGESVAIAATAQHITDFWDPRMKTAILSADHSALEPIARAAIERLAAAGRPSN